FPYFPSFPTRRSSDLNNFSAGILAAIIAGLSVFSIGPLVNGLTNLLSSGIQIILDYGLTPLASVIIEPAKILFLNNAINHGILRSEEHTSELQSRFDL